MRCELFRTDPAALIEALAAPEMLARYLAAQEAELPAIADRPLLAHLRRLNQAAARMMGHGVTLCARQDPALTDALLTDLFAVATWNGWDLPVERLGIQEVDVAAAGRGLLGSDPGREGAGLWVVDHAQVALARERESADDAEWHPHHPEGGCRH